LSNKSSFFGFELETKATEITFYWLPYKVKTFRKNSYWAIILTDNEFYKHKIINMKNAIYSLILLFVISATAISCTKDADDVAVILETPPTIITPTTNGNYSEIELEIVKLINEHRVSVGLKTLKINDFLSNQAKNHNDYMIKKGYIGHDNFNTRYEIITKEFGQGYIAENVAKQQKTAKDVVGAWLNSKGHKENIEGDKYITTGIAVTADANGALYFTNIFYSL
jgi:uncharacterized protein YkwD